MAVTEDGTNLPKDAGNRRFSSGVTEAGELRAPRLTNTDYHAIVRVEKGTPVSSRVAVGASSGLLLAANATRRKATFVNLDSSGVTVYLKPATGAAVTDYPLPYGCEYEDDLGQTAWYAISATGTVNINVCEYS